MMTRVTGKLNGAEADVLLASVTVTVKLAVMAVAWGVPEITPAALRVKPAGGVPVVTDHVYPPAPPTAVSVWL